MANTVRDIYGRLRLKDQTKGELNKFEKNTDKAKGSVVGIQQALIALGAVQVVGAIANLAGESLKLAGAFEQTQVSFEVMLGSADKAKKMLEDIDQFSLVTPFEPETLQESAKTLLQFNVASEDVLKTMQMLGDVSGGNQEKMKSLSLVFGQVSSQGKLMGQDLLQMINAGFNPLQILAKKNASSAAEMKIEYGRLKDQMSKGAISIEQVNEAFRIATSEGGDYHNMLQKQSETYEGMMSTLRGYRSAFLRSFGQEMMKVVKPFLKFLIDNIDTVRILMKALIPVIGVLLVGALYAAAVAAWAFVAPWVPFIAIGAAIAAAVFAITLVIQDFITWIEGGESALAGFFEVAGKVLAIVGQLASGNLLGAIVGVTDLVAGGDGKESSATGGVPKRAFGGPVTAGRSYMVGEKGPELFTPSVGGSITPNGGGGMGGGSYNINVGPFYVSGGAEAAREVENAVLDVLNKLGTTTLRAETGVAIGN